MGAETYNSTQVVTVAEERAREAALRELGIDPATVVWPRAEEPLDEAPARIIHDVPRLSDDEWAAVEPLLPAEAPQFAAMSNRDFLEAVLATMRRGGAWTSRHTPTAEIEAVRRRFGRWAHQGVFQAVAASLPALKLSPQHTRELMLAGQRAASLKARKSRA